MQTPMLPGWQKAQFGGAFATVVKKAGRGAKTQAGNAIVVTCAGRLLGLGSSFCAAAWSIATSLCAQKIFDLGHPQKMDGPNSPLLCCCEMFHGSTEHSLQLNKAYAIAVSIPVLRCCSAASVDCEYLRGVRLTLDDVCRWRADCCGHAERAV